MTAPPPKPRANWVGRLMAAYVVGFFVFLYLPIAFVAVFSFNDSRLIANWQGFSLRWWEQLPNDPNVWEALLNTVIAAAGTAALSIVLATFAGYALAKYRFRWRSVVDVMIFVPIIIPEVPQAVSIFLFLGESRLDLGIVAIILGHASFAVAYSVLVIRSRLAHFDFRLEEAAQSLGASPTHAFFRITLPLSFPALYAAGLLSFLLSFDDFYMTLFTAPPGVETLPILIWSMAQRGGIPPTINAIAVLMLAFSIPLSVLASRVIEARQTARAWE